MLTQKRLKELFHYDPETGDFTRLQTTSHNAKAGDIAGTPVNNNGVIYKTISVKKRGYRAHRLAILYTDGNMPDGFVDHIDGDGTNNKRDNLRVVDRQGNARNTKLYYTSTSGVPGVSWIEKKRKWRAYVTVDYRQIFLGMFDDKFEAICARKSADNRYGFHVNHGRAA